MLFDQRGGEPPDIDVEIGPASQMVENHYKFNTNSMVSDHKSTKRTHQPIPQGGGGRRAGNLTIPWGGGGVSTYETIPWGGVTSNHR